MTKEEHVLLANLALALVQTNLEFTFYRKKSGSGSIDPTGHPDFDTLKKQFAPLLAGLERSKAQVEIPAGDLYKLLQEALAATDTLRKS